MIRNKEIVFLLAISQMFFAQAANAIVLSADYINDSGDRKASAGGISQTFNADATGVRLRLGTSSIERNRFEFYFSSYNVDQEGEFNNKNEWDFGANYVFTFQELPLIPFLKVGLGIGQANTDTQFVNSNGDTVNDINNVQLNLGGGLSYALSDKFSVTGGIEFIGRRWQDVDLGLATLETSDRVIRFGVGVDYRF